MVQPVQIQDDVPHNWTMFKISKKENQTTLAAHIFTTTPASIGWKLKRNRTHICFYSWEHRKSKLEDTVNNVYIRAWDRKAHDRQLTSMYQIAGISSNPTLVVLVSAHHNVAIHSPTASPATEERAAQQLPEVRVVEQHNAQTCSRVQLPNLNIHVKYMYPKAPPPI